MRVTLAGWLAAAVLVCLGGGANAGDPHKGGEVVMATRDQVQGFDPFTTRVGNRETTMAGSLIFSSFFTVDAKGRRVPELATGLDGSPDGTTWRLTLRQGLKFSDGSAYNAAAVVHHFKRILDPQKNAAFASQLEEIADVAAVDDHTVEFRLKEPWAAFPRALASDSFLFWTMPSAHEDEAGADLNRQPIGAGPYKLAEWKPDDSITFVRNPEYWDPSTQYLDKIVVRFVPDTTARFTAVKTGDIDIEYEPFCKQVAEARDAKALNVTTYNATGAYTLQMNTASAPLDDVRVRQALAHAIDRKVEREVVWCNQAQLADAFWAADSEFGCPDPGYPAYDPERAKALLKEYGKPVKLVLQSQPTPILSLPAQLYQSFWQKVGVDVQIKAVQVGPPYIVPVLRGDYQMAWWEVPDLADPDLQVFQPFYSKSGGNSTRIKDPKIDAALELGRHSLDPAVRRQAYCDFTREMNQAMPTMLRVQTVYAVIMQPRVHDLPPMRRGLARLNRVWVDPR
ncbi:MAG: hypothetical protein JOZ27_00205 [Caulobacteraceae bacterium]|nr:hypothetical protein [Caulobacteraceae bacterium]